MPPQPTDRITKIVWDDRGVVLRRGARQERPTVFEFRGAKKGFNAEFTDSLGQRRELRKVKGMDLVERVRSQISGTQIPNSPAPTGGGL